MMRIAVAVKDQLQVHISIEQLELKEGRQQATAIFYVSHDVQADISAVEGGIHD
jgi:hypothetical protein